MNPSSAAAYKSANNARRGAYTSGSEAGMNFSLKNESVSGIARHLICIFNLLYHTV
jgi:hypothetical protein